MKINLTPNNPSLSKNAKNQSKPKISLPSTKHVSYNPQQLSQLQNISKDISDKKHIIPLPQLLNKLSRYRNLKEIPINSLNDNIQKLWRNSPCSYQFTNRNISVDRVKKFTIGSIYYKDNINEQKKVFTEFQKPQLMLKNFKRQIEEASREKNHFHKSNKNIIDNKRSHSLTKSTLPLDNKFYQVPPKTQLRFDRNGARSIFQGQYDVKQIKQRVKTKKPNFTSSQRIDLGLPLNFNPGPGKYFNQQAQADEYYGCLSYRQKRNNKKTIQPEIKTQRNRESIQVFL